MRRVTLCQAAWRGPFLAAPLRDANTSAGTSCPAAAESLPHGAGDATGAWPRGVLSSA